MIKVENKGKTNDYVYDISLDGTVVNALGMNVLSNTDGFDFACPLTHRYTDEHPYVSIGKGRNYPKGTTYTGVTADIAEFEDLYLNNDYYDGINKCGLGLDDYIPASMQIARKNYCEFLENGKVKIVGNTMKSKKMPIYIEKFLDKAIPMLLRNEGYNFIEFYREYLIKIFNMQIPLKDIASVGKIKTSIETYKEGCKQLTAGGTKKSRQAWYELAIRDKIDVHMGDAIYYINTGKKKSESDVKRITKYYYIKPNGEKCYDTVDEKGNVILDKKGNPIPLSKTIDKMYKEETKKFKEKGQTVPKGFKIDFINSLKPKVYDEDEIIFNCIRLSNNIVEDEDDHFCDENFEYNVEKYVDMFNKRIAPLLVCFDRNIRQKTDANGKTVNNILVNDPKDCKSFTREECKLVSNQPFNETDQDTYEQLMTMEDKEIRFWTSVGKEPPYTKECGMDWEKIKNDYLQRMKNLEKAEIQAEIIEYNKIIDSMTEEETDDLLQNGVLPSALLKIVTEDIETYELKSIKYGVTIGTIYDIIDKNSNAKYQY